MNRLIVLALLTSTAFAEPNTARWRSAALRTNLQQNAYIGAEFAFLMVPWLELSLGAGSALKSGELEGIAGLRAYYSGMSWGIYGALEIAGRSTYTYSAGGFDSSNESGGRVAEGSALTLEVGGIYRGTSGFFTRAGLATGSWLSGGECSASNYHGEPTACTHQPGHLNLTVGYAF